MKEIIFLSFGEYSNNVSTHFWNLNLELFKNSENKLNSNIIYNNYNQPRALLFDTSANFKNYFSKNNKLSDEDENKLCNQSISEKYYNFINYYLILLKFYFYN